jgi:ribosome-binding factor A
MSIRTEKVSSLLKTELSEIILRQISLETTGFVTVTDVTVTPDLKLARVYLSIYGSAQQRDALLKELTKRKSEIRYILGSKIRLKFTPDLQFFIDDTLDKVDSIEKIFKKIRENEK